MDKIEVGEVFTIIDEQELEQTVEVLAKVTLEETDYLAVSFLADLEEDEEGEIDIFFLKTDEDGDLTAIVDDAEFDTVSEAFDEILEEDEE
ncbi:DUF1292 domain-containing protein [Paraliobacillus sediminis]|uniref:DUF1292 domain-containing protein n=1 Tax=Paraliobacillus sediminis TaxID=1885916 RepID=UPI000E3C3763|nr:DUF1292 domain-containing protein [Paraliobacillus sediminis]